MRQVKAVTLQGGRVKYRVRFLHYGRQTSRTFDNKRAAQIFASQIDMHGVDYAVSLLDEAEERSRQAQSATLDEAADEFLAWKSHRVRSDRTVADYRRNYTKWASPTLGGRPIESLTQRDVQALVDELTTHLSPKTIREIHAELHAIWTRWKRLNGSLTASDPFLGTELPKRLVRAPKGLFPAEWRALYAALQQVDADAADLAYFLLASGWRFSEGAALSVAAVEDYGKAMWLNMSQVVRRNAKGEHVIVQDAKAQASLRRIKVDDSTARLIRRRIPAMAKPADLVFTTRLGSQWHYSNFRARAWDPAVRVANLNRKPTPHWLRHTHVAWMILSGASLPELQARIGHASIQTTIGVYGRMITDVQEGTLDGFTRLMHDETPPGLPGGVQVVEPPA